MNRKSKGKKLAINRREVLKRLAALPLAQGALADPATAQAAWRGAQPQVRSLGRFRRRGGERSAPGFSQFVVWHEPSPFPFISSLRA